jgi:hypothetical protein
MNTREAKEILLLYRGTIDDSDPQFRAALDYAKNDLELDQWLRDQTKCYDAIRAKLRAIEPRLGLSGASGRSRFRPIDRVLFSWLRALRQ